MCVFCIDKVFRDECETDSELMHGERGSSCGSCLDCFEGVFGTPLRDLLSACLDSCICGSSPCATIEMAELAV